jgi:hypothetical protein
MTDGDAALGPFQHRHVFLGAGHDRNARKTWAVIWLCGIMMAAEIIGGSLFGSLALVADGLHMSTHAGALLLAGLQLCPAPCGGYAVRLGIGAKAGTSRSTNPDRDALGYLLNPDPCVAIDGRAVGMTLISILPWRFPSFTASLPQIKSAYERELLGIGANSLVGDAVQVVGSGQTYLDPLF